MSVIKINKSGTIRIDSSAKRRFIKFLGKRSKSEVEQEVKKLGRYCHARRNNPLTSGGGLTLYCIRYSPKGGGRVKYRVVYVKGSRRTGIVDYYEKGKHTTLLKEYQEELLNLGRGLLK